MIISRRKLKLIVFTATLFYITTILVSLLKHLTSTAKLSENQQNGQIGKITKNVNSRENLIQRLNDEAFNPDLGGVLVFWHIQRTGGTYFNTQLVRLNITPSCECYTNPPFEGSCRCRNTKGEAWLFSRFTASSSCGVHPPLVDLALCVPNFLSAAEGHDEATRKRYFYITIIREPIRRYLSEWHHLQTVPPWPSECTGVENPVEVCLKAVDNHPLSLLEFIQCSGNPANNRMARMLTRDSPSLCDDLHYEDTLSSAKKALESMDFFGLTEDQLSTKKLFETSFGVKFMGSFQQFNSTAAETVLHENVNNDVLSLLHQKNSIDIELYAYAKSLFYKRLGN